jgi:hypothetical protein
MRGIRLAVRVVEEKRSAPLLQIADACAFAFRRYFAEERYGDELVSAMLPRRVCRDDWAGPLSGGLFYFHPKMRSQ